MPADFRIQRYCDADRDGVFALVRVSYSDEFANRLIRQWDWKYDSHPANFEAEEARRNNRENLWPFIVKTYSPETMEQWGVTTLEGFDPPTPGAPYLLLVKDGDKVIAMQGALPQAFLVNGTRQLVSIGCDSAVHPDYRGRKTSLPLMLRMALEHGFTFGWSNPKSASVWMKWVRRALREKRDTPGSKWGYVRVPPFVKPIDWGYLTSRTTGIQLLGDAVAVVSDGARRVKNKFRKAPSLPGVAVFQTESFDDRMDNLWHRCAPEHPVIGVRDRNYLSWRFDARPDASYARLLATRGANVIGYLVFRVAEQEGVRWGYLVDFLVEANDRTVFEMMLHDAEDRMIRAGVKGIVCVIARPPYREVLRRRGFYPALFRTPAFLGGSVTSPEPNLRIYGEVKKWFVTAGDGDVDMSF
jgi:hypothetical protein